MQVLQVQTEVRPDPAEVGRARRWARSRLAGSGIEVDESLAETLVLLISELVTNAVVHTGCPAVLRMLLPGVPESCPGTVRVEVTDNSARPPRPRQAEGDDTN
ncbi:ATP-binding protein, partial [Streptomyces boluensis]|nr:ATP-binding protein [Streptomyces boluensis]